MATKKSWRVGEHEFEYLRQLLESGFPGGSEVSFIAKLEERFAEVFASKYAISFTNGTATLHAALAASGIGPGDEVIVPPLTMSSTSYAVVYTGATLVYADVDPETFVISADSIRARVTERTRAIIPVSLYGLPPDFDAINAIAAAHNLKVIEDDAQCFLGRYRGKIVGSCGDVASFSFQNSKHITCGEGGMITTSDPVLAGEIRRFSSLGYGCVSAEPGKSRIDKRDLVRPDFIRHVAPGYNYRMSELCAAFAFAQLERLEEFVYWRQRSAAALLEAAAGVDWLKAQRTPDDCENSRWALAVKLDTDEISWQQFYDRFIQYGGDGFYGAWRLGYQEPYLASLVPGEFCHCPVAEELQPRLMQFKTNYGDDEAISRQAEALARTISYFS